MQSLAPTPRVTRALVAHAPDGNNMNLRMEIIGIRAVMADEVLVRVMASGICHSDVYYTTEPIAAGGIYPRVLGHEGSGHVVEVGNRVTSVEINDPVLLTLPSCGSCQRCKIGSPIFCTTYTNETLKGAAGVFQSTDSDTGIHGGFHGQSSFAQYTIVKESVVINAKKLVTNDEELRLFASIVCGYQTGAGSILSVANAKPTDSVAIVGLGGVGLGAIVAAKMRGCSPIIAVDLDHARVNAALRLGATHGLVSEPEFDLVGQIRSATSGYGASIVLDSTGIVKLIEAGIQATHDGGKFVQCGMPHPIMAELSISLIAFLGQGKSFLSSKAGDTRPQEFVPEMIKWYRNGDMEIRDMVTFYPIDEFEQAFCNMKNLKDIKTVLVW